MEIRNYIDIIIVNINRIIFILAVLGKIFYKTLVITSILLVLNQLGLKFILTFFGQSLVVHFFYVVIIYMEIYLIYFSLKDKQKFAIYNFIFYSFILLINVILFLVAPENSECHCFGELINFENTVNKLIFMFILFVLSLIHFFTYKKDNPIMKKD
jgi:hypothetical protein